MLNLSDELLKEIFALFQSVTKCELDSIYNPESDHYFQKTDLNEEYSLTEEKREIALDALRSTLYFLKKQGYTIYKDNEQEITIDVDELFA